VDVGGAYKSKIGWHNSSKLGDWAIREQGTGATAIAASRKSRRRTLDMDLRGRIHYDSVGCSGKGVKKRVCAIYLLAL
jgi:hypothetical protein